MKIELALRIYPGISRSPVKVGSKIETVEYCLNSLLTALKNIDFKLHIILDNCPNTYLQMICSQTEYINQDRLKIYQVEYMSGYKTFDMQIELLKSSSAAVVGFIEDDYYFEPDSFSNIDDIQNIFDEKTFYSLFNSSDYYQHRYHINNVSVENLVEGKFLNVGSTTLSFYCSPSALNKYEKIFKTYASGNSDYPMWLLITKKWKNLFTILSLFNLYDLKKILKILYYSKYLFVPSARLLVRLPGKAVHLEPLGFSVDHDPQCFH